MGPAPAGRAGRRVPRTTSLWGEGAAEIPWPSLGAGKAPLHSPPRGAFEHEQRSWSEDLSGRSLRMEGTLKGRRFWSKRGEPAMA